MELSVLIARMLGVIYLSIGIGTFTDPEFYKKTLNEITKNSYNIMMGGFIAFIIGFLIIANHNVWSGWPTIITIVGYVSVLKGFLLITFPSATLNFSQKWFASKNILKTYRFVSIFFGLLFCYYGFLI